jgi:sucrose-6-phosphate hydrolase SacC (GH32 family)
MSQALAQANDALMQLTNGDSSTQEVFGQEYSTYGNATANQMNRTMYGRDTAYNFVNASDESAMQVLFQAQLNGRKYYPQIMDYGSIYASMVFRTNDSRQVMYTWTYETAAGCANQCSDEATALTNITGFKSVLNLPRHLTYDRETETMRVYPVVETELLRSGQAYAGSDVVVPALPSTFVLLNETAIQNTTNTTARQMEAQLWFNLTAGTSGSGNASAGQPFKVGARVFTGNNTYVDVFINGTTASGADNTTNSANNASNAHAARIATMFLWVDRSNAGGYTNTTFVEGGPVPTPVAGSWLLSDTKLQLSMFIDHSMWEVYAQGGLGRVTSRVYPSDDTVDWGLGVFGDAGNGGQVLMDGAVWNMENAWLPPNCD